VSDLFEQPDDATPLTVEEQRDLIPAHISNRHELNEAEQENILRGQDWALRRRKPDLLSEKFVTEPAQADARRGLAVGRGLPAQRAESRDSLLRDS
jgi:hypothetical protein